MSLIRHLFPWNRIIVALFNISFLILPNYCCWMATQNGHLYLEFYFFIIIAKYKCWDNHNSYYCLLRANVNMLIPLHQHNHNEVHFKSLKKQCNILFYVCACCTWVTNCENHKKRSPNTCSTKPDLQSPLLFIYHLLGGSDVWRTDVAGNPPSWGRKRLEVKEETWTVSFYFWKTYLVSALIKVLETLPPSLHTINNIMRYVTRGGKEIRCEFRS